jgi:outer membrane immunogenic protein
MRKFFYATTSLSVLLATLIAANGADVPPYERPVAATVYVPPPFSWTGFYIGLNLGGAWSQRNLTDSLFGLSLSNVNDRGAFIGGGQLGYNYQFGNFVLGVEGDFDGVATTNSPGTGVVGPAFPPTMLADWLVARLNGKAFKSERWFVEPTGRIVKTAL